MDMMNVKMDTKINTMTDNDDMPKGWKADLHRLLKNGNDDEIIKFIIGFFNDDREEINAIFMRSVGIIHLHGRDDLMTRILKEYYPIENDIKVWPAQLLSDAFNDIPTVRRIIEFYGFTRDDFLWEDIFIMFHSMCQSANTIEGVKWAYEELGLSRQYGLQLLEILIAYGCNCAAFWLIKHFKTLDRNTS